ncbi:hypothetical protein E2C01_069128 [Portunus trituberculatus]|uniref:Uncharacterized protein n=1 Tax=Portunus trituberculatus TaxID=210409 RepID=A0A5B7HXR8_PORTR|nr:hypothetical protein [Portunus trituberculatus]
MVKVVVSGEVMVTEAMYSDGYLLSESPPARKPLPRVRNPNLHSDRGQDSNPCAWRPLRPQSTQGSTVPRSILPEAVGYKRLRQDEVCDEAFMRP